MAAPLELERLSKESFRSTESMFFPGPLTHLDVQWQCARLVPARRERENAGPSFRDGIGAPAKWPASPAKCP
jgi:hypothetical protein